MAETGGCTRLDSVQHRNVPDNTASPRPAPLSQPKQDETPFSGAARAALSSHGPLDSNHSRASSPLSGSATLTLPVPITAIAFRFFEPKTLPNPPCPAPEPAPWIRAPMRVLFSPAGPMVTMAGLCVV